ncbi:MAG: putative porin [Pseudohongiellaceae bacterium]|jgi:predicted porin
MMKHSKKLKLLGLAACFSMGAQAGIVTEGEWGKADFYGSLRVFLTNEDGRDLDVEDGVSRIGVKGHINWTDNWKATYRLEGRVNLDDGDILSEDNGYHRRITYIGLKNQRFGEIRGGKQLSPHYIYTILPIDITFHNPRHYNMRWNGNEGSSIRDANALSYWSPSWGGFQVSALIEADNADTESSGVDNFNVGAVYKSGAWQIGASYLDQKSDVNVSTGAADRAEDVETIGAALQFKTKQHKAVLRYQQEDWEVSEDFTTIGAYYAFTFDNGFGLQGRFYNLDRDSLNGNQIAVGVFQKFGKAGELYAEYTDYDDDAETLKGRRDDLTVGFKVNF